MNLAERAALLGLAALAVPSLAGANDLGVNISGFSYHFDRDRAHQLGVDNEFNPGLGLQYRMPKDNKLDYFVGGGAYHDSGRKTAVYAGAGALWKLGEHWRVGGVIAAFHSDTYNHGRAFIVPVPILAYETRPVTFNVIYMPRVSPWNEVGMLGFCLTFWLDPRPGRW